MIIPKQKIQRDFTLAVHTYEKAAHVQEKNAEKLAQFLMDGNCETILDIGCGSGFLSRLLQEKYPQAALEINDISPDMIRLSQEKLGGKGIPFEGDMDDLFEEEIKVRDLIVSNFSLHWSQSPLKLLQRCVQQSKKGCMGILVEGTFQSWKEYKSLKGIKGENLLYPNRDDVLGVFADFTGKMVYEKCSYSLSFQRMADFIYYLKNLGGRGLPLESKFNLKSVYRDPHSFEVTYEVVNLYWEK